MDERLKKILTVQTGAEEEEIIPETKIEEDLGIYGGDAIELIAAFGKEFNVDVSKFMAADYFSAEGDILLPGIFRALTGKRKAKQKVLTVNHLEKAIVAGRLDEEVISS